MARLPRLMGWGRALEIPLSGNDINGDLAERYAMSTAPCQMANWTRS
jgi:enoyl-CoA hydratase/carnithine racemase